MAIPLSELKFHKPPRPVISDDDNVPEDIMEMGNFLQDQYGFAHPSILSKKVEFSASALIPLWITGKTNNVPNLVSILWDIYCQWKLSKIAESKRNPNSLLLPNNYSFEYFLLYSPLGENMDFGHKKLKLCVRAVNEYYFNYFWPISRTPTAFIRDSFSAFTKYAISISQCVNGLIGKCGNRFPLHLDFWIIPKTIMVCDENAASNNAKHDDDNKTFTEQTDDIIMNIEKRLNLGNISFTKTGIKNEKDMSSIGISQLLSRKISDALKENDSKNEKKSHRRVMTIIDRRSVYYDFNVEDEKKSHDALNRRDAPLIECDKGNKMRNIKEAIYVYQVDNKYGHIPDEFIQERLLFNTQNWILPFCRVKRDKTKNKYGYDLDGGTNYLWGNQMFLLSFHINAAKDVRVYWHLNGNMMRFLPQNIADIWPMYFYRDKQLKKELKQFDAKELKKEWKLKVTNKVYDQYRKELVPQDQ